MTRSTMRFVPVKSVEQQDMRSVHRVRELLVHQRTALINQVRGLPGERGVIIAQTPAAFKRAVPVALAQCEGDMTSIFQAILIELLDQMRILEERIARTNQWIAAFMNSLCCARRSWQSTL